MIFYCPPLITPDSTIIPFTLQKDSNWYSKVVLRVFLSICALFTLKILGSNCFHRELYLMDDQMWTRWTWVWVNSGSWWWTGRPGVLRFMGSQRVGHDWATDLIWCCRTKTSGTNSSGLIQQLTESPPLPVWITLVFLSALWGSFSQDNKLTLSTQVSTG